MSDSKTVKLNFDLSEKLDADQIHDFDYLQFKSFITDILKNRGKFSDFNISKYTNLPSLTEFMRAFTHETFIPEKCYEYYEILGDKVINYMFYLLIDQKYPELADMPASLASTYGAKLSAKYTDKARFHELSNKFGFTQFIRYKEYKMLQVYSGAKEDNRYRLKYGKTDLREDVFESFWGCLNTLINEKEPTKCGAIFVFEIVKSFCDEYNILPVKLPELKVLQDPTGRIKEIWDRKEIKESGSTYTTKETLKTDEKGNWIYRLTMNNLGGLTQPKEYILIKPRNYMKDDALKLLNEEAEEILERDFNIKWEFKPKEETSDTVQFEGYIVKKDEMISEEDVHNININLFKNWIQMFLKEKLYFNQKQIDKYTTDEYMKEFERSITHETYNFKNHYSYYKTLGNKMKEYISGTYCNQRYKEFETMDPKIASDKLTKLIQNLDLKYEDVLSEVCDEIGLCSFIKYKGYTRYKKDVADGKVELDNFLKKEVFFSFLGCLNSVINREEKLKVGFIPLINYIYKVLDDKNVLPPTLPTAAELADPTTKVKEIWDKTEMKRSGSRRTDKDELMELKDEEKGIWRFKLHVSKFKNKIDNSYEKDYLLERPTTIPKNEVLKQFNQDIIDILEKEYGIIWINKSEVIFP